MRKLVVRHVNQAPIKVPVMVEPNNRVRSIKEFLRKENIKKVTQELLQELTFKVKNHIQNRKTGSAA